MTEKERTLNAIETLPDYYKDKIEEAKVLAQNNINSHQKDRYEIKTVLPYSFNPDDNYLFSCVAYDKNADKYVTWNSLNTDNNGSLNYGHYDLSEEEAYGIMNDFVKKEIFNNNFLDESIVYSYSPFGYEGSIVTVETDLRRGIPAYDIVGISDANVKETRERVRAAFKNSGLEFPSERVLQSLSPADLRKDTPLDLSMAVSILEKQNKFPEEKYLVLGELELSGKIRPVKGEIAAVENAKKEGIKNIVCCNVTADIISNIPDINIYQADNLSEIKNKILNNEYTSTKTKNYSDNKVEFTDNDDYDINTLNTKGQYRTVRALQIAAAGKHNIINVGSPGCGKTMLTMGLLPYLTPKLTDEENKSHERIYSLAGLSSPSHKKDNIPPFRIPHQTASIEGICGGGPNCRPGEISLAHNGTLFLDEAAEFRSTVLQMLRVPLEQKHITLSRAGRTTTYPADFQLALATNPCPCGNFENPNRICLDSQKSIDAYWSKISEPLLSRIEIKNWVIADDTDTRKVSFPELRKGVKNAFEIQRNRGVYNKDLNPQQLQDLVMSQIEKNPELEKCYKSFEGITPREAANLLKVTLTIANIDGRTNINKNDLIEANSYCKGVFEKEYLNINKQINQNSKTIDTKKEQINFLENNLQSFKDNTEVLLTENKKTLTAAIENKLTFNLTKEEKEIVINTALLKAEELENKRNNQNTNINSNTNKGLRR